MEHDPLCPVRPYSKAGGLVRGLCLCPEFALVRADERSKMKKEGYTEVYVVDRNGDEGTQT
jgi:hypothetical protein